MSQKSKFIPKVSSILERMETIKLIMSNISATQICQQCNFVFIYLHTNEQPKITKTRTWCQGKKTQELDRTFSFILREKS